MVFAMGWNLDQVEGVGKFSNADQWNLDSKTSYFWWVYAVDLIL